MDRPLGSHRYVEVNGAKLYTESFGHGAPIVFLHGGMIFFDNNYANQRDYFAAYRRVIGIDQRGHGHSADGPWALSYQQMANDTAAVIEQLGVGPVDIVGHSDGANIGLLIARDHPALVRRLVISGASLRSGLSAEEVRATQFAMPALNSLPRSFRRLPTDFRRGSERTMPRSVPTGSITG